MKKIDRVNERLLKEVIRNRLNFKKANKGEGFNFNEEGWVTYDGFDFSGYSGAHYKNLGLLERFTDLLIKCEREICFVIPIFWKGGYKLIRVSDDNLESLTDWIGGPTTEDIILEIIKIQNPDLFKN